MGSTSSPQILFYASHEGPFSERAESEPPGERQPEVYGRRTLGDIESMLRERAMRRGVEIEFRQSNAEGISWTGSSRRRVVLTPSS